MIETLDNAIRIGERGLVLILIFGVAVAMLWAIAFLFRYCTQEWQNPTLPAYDDSEDDRYHYEGM